jgi:hypothetical protein
VKKIEKKDEKKKRFTNTSDVFILDMSQKLHGCKTTPHVADKGW